MSIVCIKRGVKLDELYIATCEHCAAKFRADKRSLQSIINDGNGKLVPDVHCPECSTYGLEFRKQM